VIAVGAAVSPHAARITAPAIPAATPRSRRRVKVCCFEVSRRCDICMSLPSFVPSCDPYRARATGAALSVPHYKYAG